MDISFLELLLKGGFTIVVLLICSILSLKVVIEKFLVFKCLNKEKNDNLNNLVKTSLSNNKPNEAIEFCNKAEQKVLFYKVTSPLAPVFKFMINHHYYAKEDLIDSAYTRLDIETAKLQNGLGVLATLGSISPFIGLFGTVVGIIKSFNALSLNNTGTYSSVISGISEALIATAAGLFVAVPAVMFYNYFSKKLNLTMPLFDEAINDVAIIIKDENKKQ